jgi:uncharacterized membrane protein
MTVRQVVALVLALALAAFIVMVGPFLIAIVIASRKGEGRHPLHWMLATIALVFYGLKRLAAPRPRSVGLSPGGRFVYKQE